MEQNSWLVRWTVIAFGMMLPVYFASYPIYLRIQHPERLDPEVSFMSCMPDISHVNTPAMGIIYAPVEWLCDRWSPASEVMSWLSQKLRVSELQGRLRVQRDSGYLRLGGGAR